MMYTGTWMMDGVGRGGRGMWSNHMSGDFDMFGPVSLITLSAVSILFFLALLWAIAIKGYALWHAAKRNEKWWFIALLVINTFGILEIVYLIFFAKVWGSSMAKKDGVSAPVTSTPASHNNSATNTSTNHGGEQKSHTDSTTKTQ